MASPARASSVDSRGSPFSGGRLSQFPFPPVDTSSRLTSPDSQSPRRRESRASSISSIGGTLDSGSRGTRQLGDVSQNAISTLLQPPIVRTGLLPHTTSTASGALRAPSARDIPPVTLTNIPQVDNSTFKPYLAQAGSLYEAFQRIHESSGNGGSQLSRKRRSSSVKRPSNVVESPSRQQRPNLYSTLSSEQRVSLVASPHEAPNPLRRKSSGGIRRTQHAATPLSSIPTVYFDDDFHLENPRTFDIVSERSDIVRPLPATPGRGQKEDDFDTSDAPQPTARKSLATNAILQEKLSWYMDTVEVHLISSISTASTSFFAALGSLRELHSEASDSVERIQRLRTDLDKLDRESVLGGLKVINMRQRRQNVQTLRFAVEQLKSVIDDLGRCRNLVEQGQIDQALDAVEQLEQQYAGFREPSSLSDGADASKGDVQWDLSRIAALRTLPNDLSILRSRIGQAYETRFVDHLISDVRSHVEYVQNPDILQRWATSALRTRGDQAKRSSSATAYIHIDESFRSDISSALQGLSRAQYTQTAGLAYREAVLRLTKSLIRQHLPSSSDDDVDSMTSASTRGGRPLNQQEKSSILARNLRALSPEEAEDLHQKVFVSVGEALRRVSTQAKLLLDVTSGAIGGADRLKSPPLSPSVVVNSLGRSNHEFNKAGESLSEAMDMSSLTGQVVDVAQSQITKVLKVRSEQVSRLPLASFLRYFALNRLFADECEAVSGRPGSALKTVVNGHIKNFVARFGDAQRQHLAQNMDSDRWEARDFDELHGRNLTKVLESTTKDAEDWKNVLLLWPFSLENTSQANGREQVAVNGTTVEAPDDSKEKIRSATIEDQKFILPNSALSILEGLENFEHLICGIPSMTQDISMNMLEYLKLFNSRSCQLILGAGATRSAGLKNITTKHLALASQALSFIITLIPYIREHVRRHSSNNSLMIEFDKVRRLYQEHQSGIQDKLGEIMSGRSTNHIRNMRKLNWDAPKTKDDGVSSYMTDLVKETSTLHRVLSKHLPETTVKMIMGPIFQSYKEQWGEAFGEISPKTEAGKRQMLRDAEYMKARLGKLNESNDLGDAVVGVVRAKIVDEGSSDEGPGEDDNTADESSKQNGTA